MSERPFSAEAETTPLGPSQPLTPYVAPPPDSFAGYEIAGELHRGGQGVVYRAIQKATRRTVAIKVMREGPLADPREKMRFEREVQVLAALRHPNIVSIHDSGSAAGHFFYVMDLIAGASLDVYMARTHCSIRDALRLFKKICEAVNAAHLRGVIHRDLKPANILVDPDSEPHILDFGLAKMAVGGLSCAATQPIMTITGQFIGSLPWASPEQAEGTPEKIDLRTDVYSLGVILFHMLTGQFPYDVVGNVHEVFARILSSDPRKPSSLRPGVGDEVDTIVLKCLHKERERRYQSAGELARDVSHYLSGKPIEAKRDSALYVLRKHLRRRRALAAGVLAVVLMVAGFALSMWFAAQRSRRFAAEAEMYAYISQLAAAGAALLPSPAGLAAGHLDGTEPGLRSWEWYHLGSRADESLATFLPLDRGFRGVCFSPDGKRLAAASVSRVIQVWNADTGQEALCLRKHLDHVESVAYSSDGRLIASASADGTIQLWEAETGAPFRTLVEPTDEDRAWLVSAAFSPDGRCLASGGSRPLGFGGAEGYARIWDLSTFTATALPCDPDTPVTSVAFSPDGGLIATATSPTERGRSGRVRVFETSTRLEVDGFSPDRQQIGAIAFSPDGKLLAVGCGDGTVVLWDCDHKRERAPLRGHTGGVRAVSAPIPCLAPAAHSLAGGSNGASS